MKTIKQFPEIRFDPSFVEESVFAHIKTLDRDSPAVSSFHQRREQIYGKNSPQETRDREFCDLYDEFFVKLQLRTIFENVCLEFPLICESRILIFVKKVWSKKEEDTELFLKGDFKTVYIALMARRILEPSFLEAFLRHELLRISDMLDPCFQYACHSVLGGANELEDNVIRDRLRLLWDLFIAVRLQKKGCRGVKSHDERRREFEKGFIFLNDKDRASIVSQMEGCRNLTHADLLAWASDARNVKPLGDGGLRCPVCDFTSYSSIKTWPPETAGVVVAIRKDRPRWTPALGICPQCFDLYRSRVKTEGMARMK